MLLTTVSAVGVKFVQVYFSVKVGYGVFKFVKKGFEKGSDIKSDINKEEVDKC